MRELKEIKDQLKVILSDSQGVDLEEIEDNSSFKNDFGMDSLDVTEFWLHVENKFNIRTDDMLTEDLDTIQEAAEYLYGKV